MRPGLIVRTARAGLAASALAVLTGCIEGVVPSTGAYQPIQVQGAELFTGPLPTGNGPKVNTISAPSTVFQAGLSSWNVSGDADLGSYSVAMALADEGTGYWVVPVGEPDVQMSGSVVWSASVGFSWVLPPGKHDLDFVAMDQSGQAGPVNSITLDVESPVPAGKAVISLRWDSAADLDLHLVAPDGTELDPQHPTTYAGTDGMLPAGTAVLDRDANGGCVASSRPEEDAVFAAQPVPGTYLVRVDMASACGAASADFVLTVRVDGAVKDTVKGRLLARDADGGGPGTGLFVTQLSF